MHILCHMEVSASELEDPGRQLVIGCGNVANSVVSKCRTCKLARGEMAGQVMADLPVERCLPLPLTAF